MDGIINVHSIASTTLKVTREEKKRVYCIVSLNQSDMDF